MKCRTFFEEKLRMNCTVMNISEKPIQKLSLRTGSVIWRLWTTNILFHINVMNFAAELHNLYSLPNIIRMIKSRRMRWAGHVAWMGEMRCIYCILYIHHILYCSMLYHAWFNTIQWTLTADWLQEQTCSNCGKWTVYLLSQLMCKGRLCLF
jgi:hypothetical protein